MPLASAFRHANCLVVLNRLDDGRIVDVNPAWERITGYSHKEARGKTPLELALWQIPADYTAFMERLREGHGRSVVYQPVRVQTRDGRRDEGMLTAEVVNIKGVPHVFSIMHGIGPYRRQEQALQQSEARYQALVDSSQDGVFVIHNGHYIFVNRALAEMLGYPPEDMIGKPYLDFVVPEDRQRMQDIWAKRQAGEWEEHAYEVTLLRRDGKTRVLVSVRAGPINYDGELASTGTMRNITAERQSAAALQLAEQKFHQLFENSVAGMYQTTADGKFLTANAALARLLGYASPTELMESVKDIRQLYVRPDDRAAFLAELNQRNIIDGREFELRRCDNASIWVRQYARTLRNADGNVACYEGVLQDITAHKQADANLAKSEAQHRALVEHSQVGVFVREDGHYSYVNRAFAAMLGFDESELIGKHYRDIYAPEELSAAEERFRLFTEGMVQPGEYEAVLLHKDGQTRVIVTCSAGTFSQDGKTLITGTVRDITEQKRIERQLRHNATHDPLTGLPNRTLFIERLQRAMHYAQLEQRLGYAVLFLDLDGFKLVNDSLGHAAGDQLLIEISHRLQKCLRPWDTLARHGGDEFTLLLEQINTLEEAEEVARRIHATLRKPFQLGEHQVFTNASIGIAPNHASYRNTDELLRDADTAMYKAKSYGKAAYTVFDIGMHDKARLRLQLETELRHALERGEFRVHYQPLINLRNRKIFGYEALLRWQHPTRGLLLPQEFLYVLEDTGLMLQAGWWVLFESCRQLAAWQKNYPNMRDISVSVNIGPRQFTHVDLPIRVAEALQQSGVAPHTLHLEITETVFMEDPQHALTTLAELKRLGVGLHMDDFGTGYSSFSYLGVMPLDTLKIDKSFVADIQENNRHAAIVRSIAQLANEIGLETIAEGIETEQQARLLRKYGCTLGQGHFFARALPAEEAVQMAGNSHRDSLWLFRGPRDAG